jgi:hypothetical protein
VRDESVPTNFTYHFGGEVLVNLYGIVLEDIEM